jgi:hypothetical protein
VTIFRRWTIVRKVIIAVLIVLVIGGGAWYYFSQTHHAPIEKILSNPRAYEGKEVTIEGEVIDRTAFFVVVKFFKLKDKTGEITVVTRKTLPEVRATVRVKGRIDETFPVGDQKLVVFLEESVEEKGRNK